MRQIIEGAVPLVQLLWRRETEGKVFDSPERKAALDKALRDAIRVIPDPSLKSHYGQELKDLRWALFGQGRSTARRGGWRRDPPPQPTAGTRASVLAAGGAAEDALREAVILAVLLRSPGLIEEFEAEIERMECREPDHAALRNAILRRVGTAEIEAAVANDLGPDMVARLFAQPHVTVVPAVRRAGDATIARLCLAEELAKLSARRGHAREIEDAMEDVTGIADEGLTWRLRKAAESVDRAGRGDNEDRAEYDTGANGARMRRDERTALDNLLGSINFAKRRS